MIQEYFHSDQQFLFLANLEVHFYLEQSKLSLSPESYFEILSDLSACNSIQYNSDEGHSVLIQDILIPV